MIQGYADMLQRWGKEDESSLFTIFVDPDCQGKGVGRAIVGTLVYASYGKLQPEEIPELLEKGDRRLTGPTMPPQGLYMNQIWYPDFQLGDPDDLGLTESW